MESLKPVEVGDLIEVLNGDYKGEFGKVTDEVNTLPPLPRIMIVELDIGCSITIEYTDLELK